MKSVIGVDLDGTICNFDYPNFGAVDFALITYLNELSVESDIEVYTVRVIAEHTEIKEFLQSIGLNFSKIRCGKPNFAVYIGDEATNFCAFDSVMELRKRVSQHMQEYRNRSRKFFGGDCD